MTRSSLNLELSGGITAAVINGYAVGGANARDQLVGDITIFEDCG